MPSALLTSRRIALSVVEKQPHVSVVKEHGLSELIANFNAAEVELAQRALLVPVKFEDQENEVNFMAMYYMLDFGSGYDGLLLSTAQRDACETMQFGLLSMVLSGKNVDRFFMSDVSMFTVANYFGFDHVVERAVIPGIMVGEPGPLTPLVHSIRDTFMETGRKIGERGHRTLGGLMMSLLDEQCAGGQSPSAAAFIEKLAEVVPTFRDVVEAEGEQLPLYRKGQLLAAALHMRFSKEDPRCNFSDFKQLTADTGPVVAAVLHELGVLQYSAGLADVVDNGKELPPGAMEVAVRAATVVAVDKICEEAAMAFTPLQLSAYLREQVEEGKPLHGKVRPHITRGTTAY